MNAWILVGVIVGSTVMGDLLQSLEMKRHGEISNFHPRGLSLLAATLAKPSWPAARFALRSEVPCRGVRQFRRGKI